MYTTLYRYFIQNKILSLPEFGQFILERKPAEADFINKCIHPPVFSIGFKNENSNPGIKFYSWLASTLNITDKEALSRFNEFVVDLKNQIQKGNTIEWEGLGILNKGLAGEIKFIPADRIVKLPAIPAEKIIREKAEHAVLVGEKESNSVEMSELLNQPETKKSLWWLTPLAILLLALMFIGWHFSKHGVKPSAPSNNSKAETENSYPGYRGIN